MLEQKKSWKVGKTFVEECSNDDLGLILTFYGKVKFAFGAFRWEEIMELVK